MLTGFLTISALSIAIMAVTSLLAYEIMRWTWNRLLHVAAPRRLRVLLMLGPIFAVHIIGIWIYAISYFLIENYTGFGSIAGASHVVGLNYLSFMDCLYFSASTYASLGLGDIAPIGDLRMLAMAEVLNGLVMIGWTVSLTYLAMTKFWDSKSTAER
jgi:hypothetical protein